MRFPAPMKVLGSLVAVALLAVPILEAGADESVLPLLDYRTESWFLPQSPSVTGGPAAGLFNPAAFGMTGRSGFDLWWNDRNPDRPEDPYGWQSEYESFEELVDDIDSYGLAFGRTLNFAMLSTRIKAPGGDQKVYDYQLGLAGGHRAQSWGLAYRWSNGALDHAARQQVLSMGMVTRIPTSMTFGAAANLSLESAAAQYVFDLGVRPLGRPWLTLFADWTANHQEAFFKDGTWGAGLEIRPWRGIHIGGRARDRQNSDKVDLAMLLGFTFQDLNFSFLPFGDPLFGDEISDQYLLRISPPFEGFEALAPTGVVGRSPVFHRLDLQNKILTYQKYLYFDDKHIAWLDLLAVLNNLLEDDQNQGLLLNLSSFKGRPSLLWEMRQKLAEFKAAGKSVTIHADNLNPETYYLASVADNLQLDPWGMISLPGQSLSRSYLKGTLAKLGLGFQEFRYFKYKSAVEALSRDSMSEADREQRQRIVDVIYETQRDGVAACRPLDAAAFERVIDEKVILTAPEALELGLIDGFGRWKDLQAGLLIRDARPIDDPGCWDEQWGPTLKIPVVYLLGSCAMDKGIRGRRTSQYLGSLVKNPNVAAVVLRVDSPGGDPLPSDLIAEATRTLRQAGKPVIVSQGDVAASGGYWLSMDGTRILTTPLTITGSIGVISGWIWDEGFAASLGLTSDEVHRGKHADLFSPIHLPFLGSLPRRGLNDEELILVKELITGHYDRFVQAVASGRGLETDFVDQVAQGRVWMGGDAVERGLCDQIGGLEEAIELAKQEAGLTGRRQVEIVEFPHRPLVKWPSLTPKLTTLFGLGTAANRLLVGLTGGPQSQTQVPDPALAATGLAVFDLEYLRWFTGRPGQALMLVEPDLVPEGWRQLD